MTKEEFLKAMDQCGIARTLTAGQWILVATEGQLHALACTVHENRLGIGDVWHAGSDSFYRALFLEKITPEQADACTPNEEIQKLRDALEAAKNGLEWYRDAGYPMADSPADDEMMYQINDALGLCQDEGCDNAGTDHECNPPRTAAEFDKHVKDAVPTTLFPTQTEYPAESVSPYPIEVAVSHKRVKYPGGFRLKEIRTLQYVGTWVRLDEEQVLINWTPLPHLAHVFHDEDYEELFARIPDVAFKRIYGAPAPVNMGHALPPEMADRILTGTPKEKDDGSKPS